MSTSSAARTSGVGIIWQLLLLLAISVSMTDNAASTSARHVVRRVAIRKQWRHQRRRRQSEPELAEEHGSHGGAVTSKWDDRSGSYVHISSETLSVQMLMANPPARFNHEQLARLLWTTDYFELMLLELRQDSVMAVCLLPCIPCMPCMPCD